MDPEPTSLGIRALSLAERNATVTTSVRASLTPQEREEAARTVRWWEETYFRKSGPQFTQRLKAEGLNRRSVVPLIALGRRHDAGSVDPAALGLPDFPDEEAEAEAEHAAFIRAGWRRVAEAIDALDASGSGVTVDRDALREQFVDTLIARLNRAAVPTFVLEMHVAKLSGQLGGGDPAERFRRWAQRAVVDPAAYRRMMARYPALLRIVAAIADGTTEAWVEVLQRLGRSWPALSRSEGSEASRDRLVRVEGSDSDAHRRGRSVMFLTFESGRRIVYKPRPMGVDVHFYELLEWLAARGLTCAPKAVRVVDGGDHGWMDLVTAEPCTSIDEVRAFFRRQGVLLMMLYLLEGVDSHAENLVAAGAHPVLIDLEALFQSPPVGGPVTVRRGVFEDSVLRTGMLPIPREGTVGSVDLSGLADTSGQKTPHRVPDWLDVGTDRMRLVNRSTELKPLLNVPVLDGRSVPAIQHLDDIVAGFTEAYRVVWAHRSELAGVDGPLAAFADDRVRHVLRNTADYAVLLDGSLHPSCLRDAIQRDFVLDCLWLQTDSHPHLARLIRSEREDLWDGDIPVFDASVSSTDLVDSRGRVIAEFFESTGLDRVLSRLRRLDEADLARQIACIHGTVCTVVQPPAVAPMADGGSDREATADEMLGAATRIGERLSELAVRRGDEAFWTGQIATPSGGAMWGVVSDDLYEGNAGIALFLTHLACATGRGDFEDLARAAAQSVRNELASSGSDVALGGFTGIPGRLYALSTLATLWDDAKLASEVEAGLDVLRRDRSPGLFDVLSGAAGCVLVMLRLARTFPGALDIATRYGHALLRGALRVDGDAGSGGLAWPAANPSHGPRPMTGMSHGAAGIAWALGELAAATGDSRFAQAAAKAVAYEAGLFDEEMGNWPDFREADSESASSFLWGWCHGAPGIGLARLMMLEHCPGVVPDARLEADVRAAMASTEAHGFNDGHSLCHGDLGNAELFVTAARVLGEPDWLQSARRRAHAVLADQAETGHWRCNRRDFTELPGLMMGIAGIGYGLLRTRNPETVPSILTLDR